MLAKLKLYQGPSGPELRGDNGDVLTYDAATESWVARAPSGGGGAPLAFALFVDAGTTVPEESRNGSIGAPFATVGAGIAALKELPGAGVGGIPSRCLIVFQGDYTGEADVTWDPAQPGDLQIIGGTWQGSAGPARLPNPEAYMPAITIADGQFYGSGLGLAFLENQGNSAVTLIDCLYEGEMTLAGALYASGTRLETNVSAVGVVELNSCILNTAIVISIDGTLCSLRDSTFVADSAFEVEFTGEDGGAVQVDASTLYGWLQLTNPVITNGNMVSLGSIVEPADVVLAVPGALAAGVPINVSVDIGGKFGTIKADDRLWCSPGASYPGDGAPTVTGIEFGDATHVTLLLANLASVATTAGNLPIKIFLQRTPVTT